MAMLPITSSCDVRRAVHSIYRWLVPQPILPSAAMASSRATKRAMDRFRPSSRAAITPIIRSYRAKIAGSSTMASAQKHRATALVAMESSKTANYAMATTSQPPLAFAPKTWSCRPIPYFNARRRAKSSTSRRHAHSVCPPCAATQDSTTAKLATANYSTTKPLKQSIVGRAKNSTKLASCVPIHANSTHRWLAPKSPTKASSSPNSCPISTTTNSRELPSNLPIVAKKASIYRAVA